MNDSLKKWFLAFALLLIAGCYNSDDDDSELWNAETVCPAEGTNAYGMPNRGTFTDERDGQVYKYTTINDEVWMAENLRYGDSINSESLIGNTQCYNDIAENCEIYGRSYTWAAAIDSVRRSNDTTFSRQGICPEGWHLPYSSEWNDLIDFVGGYFGYEKANKELKSTNGWNEDTELHDNYGFSVIPTDSAGTRSYFWTASELTDKDAMAVKFSSELDYVDVAQFPKRNHFSIRCVHDKIKKCKKR